MDNSNNTTYTPGRCLSNGTENVFDASELSEVLPDGEEPEYYHETAVVDRHKLTAVEGQLQPLVWICRICGETAANSGVFREEVCDG